MFIVEAFFFKSSACSARNTRRQSRRRNRSKTRSMESRLNCDFSVSTKVFDASFKPHISYVLTVEARAYNSAM